MLTGTFGIEALQTGSENRLGGCISTTSSNNDAALKLMACNDKDEKQRWTYTLDGKLIVSY